MDSYDIEIEWDENGCYLVVLDVADVDARERYRLADPEGVYDRVKAAILPWLMERDEALREYRLMGAAVEADMREAYDLSDPKQSDFHDTQAARWDSRPGK